MKLMTHNRAPSRLALAGLLAMLSCSAFAQAQRPGTIASAQAQSQSTYSPAGKSPSAPSARGPGAFAPGSQASGNGESIGTPGAPMQADGRLKPKVIYPESNDESSLLGANGSNYNNGSSYPGSMNHSMHPGQMGQQPGFGTMPNQGGMPQATGPRNDPFSPAGAMQPPAQPGMGGMPQQAASPKKTAQLKKAKESVEDGPSINLQCTTPEIKAQGVFVGKIQNRYVYKYKSQYCFDLEP